MLVGVCAGLAALSKYSAALVILPVAFIWLLDLGQVGWKRATWGGFLLALGGGLVAGPWFLPNLLQWGTPIPMDAMLELLPGLARPEPLSWAQVFDAARWLRRSYWGVYGYGAISSQTYYQVVSILMAGGGLGLF
jgi:4-amino-4-deoxy-L-arabinose transferase-like glycosyltransferase